VLNYEFSCALSDRPLDSITSPQSFEWPLAYDMDIPVTRQGGWTDVCGGEAAISLTSSWPFMTIDINGDLDEAIPSLAELLTADA
jgi:hypothetical protein